MRSFAAAGRPSPLPSRGFDLMFDIQARRLHHGAGPDVDDPPARGGQVRNGRPKPLFGDKCT